jgi:hypothetical protein
MLKGQWFGPFAGTNSGNIIAEFDQFGPDLVGTVTAYSGDPVPPTFTVVTIPIGRQSFETVLQLQPIDFATGNPVPWESIASQHPGLTMSRLAETKWALSPDNTLYVSWVTDTGNHGTAVLKQGRRTSPRLSGHWPLKVGLNSRTSLPALSLVGIFFAGTRKIRGACGPIFTERDGRTCGASC